MKLQSLYRACVAAALIVCFAVNSRVYAAADSSSGQRCAALANTDFSNVPETPTRIVKTTMREANATAPAHCLVEGVITPNVGFALRLPTVNWNGRFFEAGCGNWCGLIFMEQSAYRMDPCGAPLRKGYACIVTDSGHKAAAGDVFMTDAHWASNSLQAQLDYGGRATHVTALAGKAITENYYGKAPVKSYFDGCSYGGHQAMVETQRFP